MRFIYLTWQALADQLGYAGRAMVVFAAVALLVALTMKLFLPV